MNSVSCYVSAASRGHPFHRIGLEERDRMKRTRGLAAADRQPGGPEPAHLPRPAAFAVTRTVRRCVLVILALSGVAGAFPAQAANDFGTRPYVRLGLGRALFLSPEGSPGLHVTSPSSQPLADLTVGFDLSKYWGLEFSVDYMKTDLDAVPRHTLGDFSTIAGTAAIRLRYPLGNGRFVPYALLGGGNGFGDFSGRKDFNYPIGGRGWSLLGVAGVGGEYFLYRNIAMGFEAKDFFAFRPDLTVNGRKQTINADSVGLLAEMRVYFDSPKSGPKGSNVNLPPAKDTGGFRPYIVVGGGKAVFTNTTKLQANGIVIDSTSGPLLSGGMGANFTRYFGAELAMQYGRAQLRNTRSGLCWPWPGFAIQCSKTRWCRMWCWAAARAGRKRETRMSL